jgi:hypothetical protein
MTAPEMASGGSIALAGRSAPMGNHPADDDAREDEKADGDGETEPEGEAGQSGHGAGNRESGIEDRSPRILSDLFIRFPASGFRFPAPEYNPGP